MGIRLCSTNDAAHKVSFVQLELKPDPCVKVRWVAIDGCGVLRFCFVERLCKRNCFDLCPQLGRIFRRYQEIIKVRE